MVIPLKQCVARPPIAGEEPFWLLTHLEAVADGTGDKSGSPEDKLAYLAGLAHDAAKAAPDWQDYIRGGRKKGPSHAPLGAAVYAFWADDLIPRWIGTDRTRSKPLYDLILDWIQVIYRHHGAFDDLGISPPWTDPGLSDDLPALLESCDIPGLDNWIRGYFPELKRSLNDFRSWYDATGKGAFEHIWQYALQTVRPGLLSNLHPFSRDVRGLRLAELGAKLIFADRRHAADWNVSLFDAKDAEGAIQQQDRHCKAEGEKAIANKANPELLAARSALREEALRTYQHSKDHSIFTLLLPTGYGKTLTGLRVALEALRSGRCERLIYVAPYISILSQNAGVLEQSTGLRVFLHHHLSILELAEKPKEDRQAEDHQRYDVLDTWQAPIIATTFNQLFRALFPSRAQQCVRIPALDNAFLFIDEPQIVNPTVWCAFLRALAILTRQRKTEVLFCTATLPPLTDGLGLDFPTCPLVADRKPALNRYVIHANCEPWDLVRTGKEALQRFKQHGSVAVILNTVRDALETYQLASHHETNWFFLAAPMLPGHKASIIQRIYQRLVSQEACKPTGVVCTQVLEAGVDLSFRSLLRAKPIFPSIAQAAGRANRHGEGVNGASVPAEVVVFTFIRADRKDSSRFVYRDLTARQQTDHILRKYPTLSEIGLPEALTEYYQRCWEQNPHMASLQWFFEAAKGVWSALAAQEPFDGDYPRIDVLVPGAEKYLDAKYHQTLRHFGAKSADELLDRYLTKKFPHPLSFVERKQVSVLLQQFTVALPVKYANDVGIAEKTSCEWLRRLSDAKLYRESTGLAHCWASDNGDDPSTLVF